MLGALPKKPGVISTDKGHEWVGPVDAPLDAKGIIRRTKVPRDVNALGVVDRAIQNLKQRLAESLSADPGEWASRIKEVVAAYNSMPHATVHGEPKEVRKNPVQEFLITHDSAAKLKGNQALLESRKKELADKGGFRRPLRAAGGAFRRGFKARGEKIDIKRVQPVDRDTGDVQPWLGGLSMRDFVKDGEEHSVASAALYLKQHMGRAYEDTLRELAFGRHLAAAVELFPEFELTRKNYYLRLA